MRRAVLFVAGLAACADVGSRSPVALSNSRPVATLVSPFSTSERAVWDGFLASGVRLIAAARDRRSPHDLIDLARRLDENRAEAERLHGSLPPDVARSVNDLRANIREVLSEMFEAADVAKSPPGLGSADARGGSGGTRDGRLPGGFDGAKDTPLVRGAERQFVFRWPLHGGTVGVPFGYRRDPIELDRLGFHDGVDMPAQAGDPVFATAPGVVASAGKRGGGGLVVSIDHSRAYKSFYMHLSRAFVAPGDRVSGGSLIALAGNTGRSTGPHLHFTIHRNGKAVDPVSVIGLRVDRVIE